MRYIEALDTYNGSEKKLFTAGGITGCPDWQHELINNLTSTDLVIFNPRRKSFSVEDKTQAPKQIKWEFDHLRKADAISFWFAKETMQPITLYELGAWSMTDKPLFIGAHPEYQRLQDVVEQTLHVRPNIKVVDSLEDLTEQILLWEKKGL